MRIAYLTPTLHPGGAERQMLFLAAELPRDTFDVRFLTMSEPGELASEAEHLGIPVWSLGIDRERCSGVSPRCLGAMMGAVRAYLHHTRDVAIVDAWLVPAYTFAGALQPLARVPVLLAGRRSALDVARTRVWYREAAGRFAMRHVDGVVANSAAAAQQAIADEHIDPATVHVVRNAVAPANPSDQSRNTQREAWGFAATDIVVGCVGNFKAGKGQGLLLEVATMLRERHSELRFVFVGNGSLRPWLEEEIAKRGLTGRVVLHSGEPDARRVYGAFDIAAQASDTEGLPNCVLEAAAAGLPIVATNVGGTSEILTSDQNGLLVARGDQVALADAIGRLASEPELRARLAEAARLRAADFSPRRLADETASLYLRLARSKGIMPAAEAGI